MSDKSILAILSIFNDVTSKSEEFVKSSELFTNHLKQLIKQTYDFLKQEELKVMLQKNNDSLPELIVKDFDLEQIWQQLELQNGTVLNNYVVDISKFVIANEQLKFKIVNIINDPVVINEKSDTEIINEPLSDTDSLTGVKDENNDVSFDNEFSETEDRFFDVKEMNNFLMKEEIKVVNLNKNDQNDASESDDSINIFAGESDTEDDDGDSHRNPRYKDFFREKKSVQDELNTTEVEEYNSDTNMQTEQKSSLELREERLRDKIEVIEAVAVGEKPWQLKGEVTAESRPQNSLLGEILEFDIASRPAPIIMEQTTRILEDVIRQRIKDRVFDDVVRKQKIIEPLLEYRKKLMLNQEKSKESLAEIYEKAYIQQQEATHSSSFAEEKREDAPEEHKKIRILLKCLFGKLDALSNFHYSPKPIIPELKIINNLPAINAEEAVPMAASEATLLAPEEVMKTTQNDLIGKSERTATDKKRERKLKKTKQRVSNNAKKRDSKSAISNAKPTKAVKSSSEFFTQLQENMQSSSICSNKRKTVNYIKKVNNLNAKRMKL